MAGLLMTGMVANLAREPAALPAMGLVAAWLMSEVPPIRKPAALLV